MSLPILPTTVVGSYPQPAWLVDLKRLKAETPPRVRLAEVWRVPEPYLESAQDDATLLAIRDMERAGIDIITDGEIRRESYSNRFATSLEGLDVDRPHLSISPTGLRMAVPRVVGKVRRRGAAEVRDVQFLRTNTDRTIKITLPGPFTIAQQSRDEFYHDPEAVAMAFAAALNEEAHDLQRAGADIIQIDEPWLRNDPIAARRFAVKAINRALEGITVPTIVHLCFGYANFVPSGKPTGYSFLAELADSTADQISIEAAQPKLDLGILSDLARKTILVGVLDLSDPRAESVGAVADRLRAALKFVSADRLIPAPDCGMKYLPRELAFAKLQSLSQGAAIVRKELCG